MFYLHRLRHRVIGTPSLGIWSSFREKTVVGGDQSPRHAGPAMIGMDGGEKSCMHERGGGQLAILVTLSRRQIKEHNQAPFPWHFP